MIFVIVIFLVIIFVIVLFSFPQFSPIPYFPSNIKDMKNIIQALHLKNNQVVFDLGAGDGIVIFKAAEEAFKRKLDTKFVAVEINPVLICILYVRKLLHPNKRNIKVVYGDMFTMDLSRLTFHVSRSTFYLYISPWHLEKTVANIRRQFKQCSIISYMYPVKNLKKSQVNKKGVHPVYRYESY